MTTRMARPEPSGRIQPQVASDGEFDDQVDVNSGQSSATIRYIYRLYGERVAISAPGEGESTRKLGPSNSPWFGTAKHRNKMVLEHQEREEHNQSPILNHKETAVHRLFAASPLGGRRFCFLTVIDLNPG